MYKPREDSLFFADFLKDYFSKMSNSKKEKLFYLDMGTGSGILIKTALKGGLKKENIIGADIDNKAIKECKKLGVEAIKSNLFKNPKLKNKKFDLITFNAPYLPEDKREPKESQKQTTGGKKGDEISIEFLKQAKKHLSKKGRVFLLISSLTPLKRIKRFNMKIIKEKKLFFEELLIIRFY